MRPNAWLFDRARPCGSAARLRIGVITAVGVGVATALAAGCDGPVAEAAPGELVSSTLAAPGATNPTVALTGEDGAYVAWVAIQEGVSNVLLSRVGADGEPGDPIRVNDIEGDAAPHGQAPAQVATGPANEVYVVWQSVHEVEWLDFGASDVRFARSADGGRTWDPAITVNDNPADLPARNTFHDVSVAPDGTIYVSWIDARVRDGYRGEVFRGTGQAPDPKTEPGTEIRIARSTDGGRTFSPSVVLESNSCPCCRTSTAVAPDGTVYVSYRKVFPGEIRDIVVVRSADGGATFSEPVRVHADDWHIAGCPHAGASLSVDGEGRLHVAWFSGAEADPGAFYSVSADQGRTFAEPIQLTPEGPVPTSLAAVAADAAGTAWVAWEDLSGEDRRIALARVAEDGSLERVELDAPAGAMPSMAAGDGSVALAWQAGEAVRVVTSAVIPTSRMTE